ncbi:hypothetical protein [Devosia sp. Root635]|uniref:hypothetical protein n=1 Tax=Devosia sp. Root635 TaxID=1736575 RepID=UPI000A9E4329|nr:hypothetical protein [Devosia sp. Root635]
MLRRALAIITTSLCLVFPAMAQQEVIDRFVALKTAQAIDENCRFFKQFERDRIGYIESDLLARLDFARNRQSGKISEADYLTQYDALEAQAGARAETIACTDNAAAGAYILPLRGEAAPAIYADLMIAVQMGNLTPEQTQAAHAFEGMIQPLYSQNWQGFVQYAQQQAQAKLDEAKQADLDSSSLSNTNLFGGLDGLGGGYAFGDYSMEAPSFNLDFTVQSAVRVADNILFEIVAEQARYRLIKKHNPEVLGYIRRLTDGAMNPVADVWQDVGRYPTLEEGPSIYAVFTLQPDGSTRVMTFGADAGRVADGSVTVLVHPRLGSDLGNDFTYARGQEWWDAATVFEATRIEDGCLGGPCFSLPAELVPAILEGGYGQYFRFFFSTASNPEMPLPTDLAIQTNNTYELFARQSFLAAEAP